MSAALTLLPRPAGFSFACDNFPATRHTAVTERGALWL